MDNNASLHHRIFQALLAACVLPCVVLPRQVCADVPQTVSSIDSSAIQRIIVSEYSATSQRFRERVRDAVASVPAPIWKSLHRAGWRLQAVQFVVDADPSLKRMRPRGWPKNMTWENTDAAHLPRSRRLIIAEKLRSTTGEVLPSRRVEGNLRHEVGHAFDMLLGQSERFRSSSISFLAAYQRDWDRLPAQRRRMLAYYSQAKAAGPQEAFAEAFAIHLGGGSDPNLGPQFTTAFPSVMDFVVATIKNYRPGPSTDRQLLRKRIRR